MYFPTTNINFIGLRKVAISLSLLVILICFASFFHRGGFNLGIDFAGGLEIQIKFFSHMEPESLRGKIGDMKLGDVSVQGFGEREENEYLIRVEKAGDETDELAGEIEGELIKVFGEETLEVRRVEMVGPKVGKDLRKRGVNAIFYALIGLLIYIAWRFELKFAPGAILALIHDIIITVGAFVIMNKEFNLATIAALLTIVGYSLNDTIVVYDRIRENIRRLGKKNSYETIINVSINQTISRTIITSLTTLIVVVSLFILGGGIIHDFAFALLVGVLVGTYSSIFIASPVLLFWKERFEKK